MVSHSSLLIIHLDETNFQSEVLDCNIPVLVDFWTEHCGPCKQLAPVLEQLASEMGASAKVCKLDAAANMKVTASYGVRSVPNLLFFKNGEVKDQFVGGNITKEQMRAKLEALGG